MKAQKQKQRNDATAEMSVFNRDQSSARKEEAAPPSLWLITFTDIMALMLTFFVLLYSMSVPQEEKWEELSESVNKGLSKFKSPQSFSGPQDTISIEKLDNSQALNLDYLDTLLSDKIRSNANLQNITLIRQSNRLIISLPQDLLFKSGEAEIGLSGKRALFTLGGILERIRNRIEIIGHSDPRPMPEKSGNFSSNWELSLARAVQVSNVLLQVGYTRGVTVRGVSSARYDELPSTISEEKRNDLSRRVDIVIMEDDGTRRTFINLDSSG